MMLRSAIGLTLALALLQFIQGADESSQDSRLVDLNVIALDNHGQPVADLTRDDFQIADAGKQQTIAFFRQNNTKPVQAPALGPNEFANRGANEIRRTTVILFDLLNEGFATRGVAANQIVKELGSMDNADGLYLYLLTVDGKVVAVHGIAGPADAASKAGGTQEPWTRQIKPLLDEALRAVMQTRPVDIDVAVRIPVTYRALDMLAAEMSRLPGRKNIVWVTDGVPIALGPYRSDTGDFVDYTAQQRQLSERLDLSSIAIYPVRQVMLGSRDDIGAASGAGYAGTGGGGTGVQDDATLNDFANTTGGRPNAGKDIGAAVKQSMADLRNSYQIGYYVPPRNLDGKFHKLRVTCKRKGVRIQAKTGYYAWKEEPGARAQLALNMAASAAFDAAEIGLRATWTPDPKDPHMAALDVHINGNDVALARDGERYTGELRLAVVGYLADGRAQTTPIIPLDLHYSAQERDQALKDGIDFNQKLPVAPEQTRVRFVVFDRGSNAVGSLTIPVRH